MFDIFILDSHEILKSETGHIDLEESGRCLLNVHVLKQYVDTCREGNYSSVDGHVVFSFVNVICDYLDGEIGKRQEAILRKVDCTNSF